MGNKKKRNKHVQAFVRGFVRTGCIMILMFLVGFTTYKLTIGIYRLTHKEEINAGQQGSAIANDGTADNVCKNLIYITDDKGDIEGVVLEILNTYTNNLDYVTIPQNTQYALSGELYQKLYAKNQQIPQIISLDNMDKYFDNTTKFAYGEFMVNELLGTELSCYTIINKETADSIFEEKTSSVMLPTGEIVEGSMYVLKDSIIESIDPDESFSMKEYLAKFYEVAQSNLTLANKQKYAQTYRSITSEYIHYYRIPGVEQDDCYGADKELTVSLIQSLLNNEAYTQSQDTDAEASGISSVGLKISLLNGSKITGLATKYSSIVKQAGFEVTEVGNYTQEVLQTTKIIVREEGMGRDLMPLFNEASIEVGTLPVGIDIQVILGVSENN